MAKTTYFEVTVSVVVSTNKSGKQKKEREIYLVDAMSVTEAEAKVLEEYKESQLDYEVLGAKKSRITTVL